LGLRPRPEPDTDPKRLRAAGVTHGPETGRLKA
jgi:hypothetical protein